MIEKNNLMYGNLAVLAHESNAPIVTIDEIRKGGVFVKEDAYAYYYPFEQLMPIQLNPDWLKKLGFVLCDKVWWEIPKMSDWRLLDNSPFDKTFSVTEDHTLLDIKPLMFVHQLQNLYFALTGKELTIKSNDNVAI